jgi:hypothetical protein
MTIGKEGMREMIYWALVTKEKKGSKLVKEELGGLEIQKGGGGES